MEIAKFSSGITLAAQGGVLSLNSGGEALISGVYEIGTEANGLIPLCFDRGTRWAYWDVEMSVLIEVQGVNWISGFHYVGSDLNYMNHNFRTDPQARQPEEMIVKTSSSKIAEAMRSIGGVDVTSDVARKFNFDSQKMEETAVHSATFAEDAWKSAWDSIRNIRIVGTGVCSSSVDMAKSFVKDGSEIVYRPKKMSLSQSTAHYGIMNVVTGELIAPMRFAKVEIFPGSALLTTADGVEEVFSF